MDADGQLLLIGLAASGSVVSTTPSTTTSAAVTSRAANRTAVLAATSSPRPQASISGATSCAVSWTTRNDQAANPVAKPMLSASNATVSANPPTVQAR